MRITAYSLVLAGFFAVLLAFAGSPVLAQMTSDEIVKDSGVIVNPKPKLTDEADFSGEAKAGASQEKDTQAGMKDKAQSEGESSGKAGIETKAGKKNWTDPRISPEFKSGEREGRTMGESRAKPETKSSGDVRGEVDRGARGEMDKKSEAQRPDAREERQARGGEAVVSGVDRPDNCLRIRSGPGTSHDVVACAAEGNKLRLTGEFSRDGRWAQVQDGGWVFFRQLDTDVRRPESVASGGSFDQPAAAAGKKESRKRSKGYHGYGGAYTTYYYGPGYYGSYYGGGYCPGFSYGFPGRWY